MSVGLSVGLGFIIKAIFAPDVLTNSSTTNICIGSGFVLGTVGLWAFTKYLLPKLDKAKPAFVYEQLPAPVKNENGVTMTHRPVAVVNQETGEQVWTKPSSTFFFFPVRYWIFVLAAISLINLLTGVVGVAVS